MAACSHRRSRSCAGPRRSWRRILPPHRQAVSGCSPAATAISRISASTRQSDGTPIFDVIDFDETLPAPFEWDLKRLATSVAVDAHGRQMPEHACRDLAAGVVTAYRQHMAKLMRLDPQVAWMIARRCDKSVAAHRRCQAAAARTEAPAHRGRGASQRLSQAAGASQVRLAHSTAAAAHPTASCRHRTTRSNWSPTPRSRLTR